MEAPVKLYLDVDCTAEASGHWIHIGECWTTSWAEQDQRKYNFVMLKQWPITHAKQAVCQRPNMRFSLIMFGLACNVASMVGEYGNKDGVYYVWQATTSYVYRWIDSSGSNSNGLRKYSQCRHSFCAWTPCTIVYVSIFYVWLVSINFGWYLAFRSYSTLALSTSRDNCDTITSTLDEASIRLNYSLGLTIFSWQHGHSGTMRNTFSRCHSSRDLCALQICLTSLKNRSLSLPRAFEMQWLLCRDYPSSLLTMPHQQSRHRTSRIISEEK